MFNVLFQYVIFYSLYKIRENWWSIQSNYIILGDIFFYQFVILLRIFNSA